MSIDDRSEVESTIDTGQGPGHLIDCPMRASGELEPSGRVQLLSFQPGDIVSGMNPFEALNDIFSVVLSIENEDNIWKFHFLQQNRAEYAFKYYA